MRPRVLFLGALLACATPRATLGAEIDATGEERIRDPEPRRRHWIRAAEEIFVINGPIGTVWYWSNADFNQADWDLRWDWPSWRRKIVTFDALRFDSNDFGTNAFNHSLSGTAYYWTARANGLSIAQSFLMANIGSLTWEYVVEYKEYPSLNDVIFTPIVGIPFGEGLYQLGELFDRGSDAIPVRVLAEIFGFPRKLHDRIDRSQGGRAPQTDALGLPSDTHHRFVLSSGIARVSQAGRPDASRAELGLETEVVTLPHYGGPGHAGGFVTDRGFTRFSFDLALGERRVERLGVTARASLFGYYHQEVRGHHGASVFVGAATEFEYVERWVGDILDRLGIVRAASAVADATLHVGPVRVRAAVDVSPDFAMITSLSWPAWLATGKPASKSVLHMKGYYYAVGLSVLPTVTFTTADVEAGFGAKWEAFASIDGVDRFQENVVDDARLTDHRLEWRAFFGVHAVGPLHLSASVTERHRASAVAGFTSTSVERTLAATARLVL